MMRIFSLIFSLLFLGGCSVQAVQQEVKKNYSNEKELIYAYPSQENSEYLSESIGLYMEYLVMMEDKGAFEQQYKALKDHFIVEKEDKVFIRWRLYEDVNALIDDVRIVLALTEASSKFDEPKYKNLATRIGKTISSVQKSDGYIVDYYDWVNEIPAQRVTLSYLIDGLANSEKEKGLLKSINTDVVFFPEYYDVNKKVYSLNSEVHMIDQLLIALNRESIGVSSPLFKEWVISEWNEKGKVLGRYSRESLEPTVEYESLSVYYYLKLYFLNIDEKKLAEAVQQHAEEVKAASGSEGTHFFDYIHYEMMKHIESSR